MLYSSRASKISLFVLDSERTACSVITSVLALPAFCVLFAQINAHSVEF